MKIFNKCLKKQINSNFFLNSAYITNSNLNKFSLTKRTFARNIGRPMVNEGDANTENKFEEKFENKNFQATPKIKIENNKNDFENSFASQNFDGDKAFSRDREFKQKKGGNLQNDNSADSGENQNLRDGKRESFGDRENRGFRGDREYRNKTFDDKGSDSFREKRNFDRGSNFESNIEFFFRITFIKNISFRKKNFNLINIIFLLGKDKNFVRAENEFGGERKFERRKFDGESNINFLI